MGTTVYVVVTEDLFSRSWASDTVSEIMAVTTNKDEALKLAKDFADKHKLVIDEGSDDVVTYWDDDEGALFVKVSQSTL